MKNIKDMLSRLVLMCRLETAIVEELENLNKRVYALEQDLKLRTGTIRALETEVASLKLSIRNKASV